MTPVSASQRIAEDFNAAQYIDDMPPVRPTAMPTQSLERAPSRVLSGEMVQPWFHRGLLLAFTVASTLLAVTALYKAFSADRLTGVEMVHLSLFAALFAWTAFAFVSALAGFILSLDAPRQARSERVAVTTRNAILAPVYNEDPGPVFARLQAMLGDLARTGQGDKFDLFVLSDTRDDRIAAAEDAAFRRLRRDLPGLNIWYRRRVENTDRKAGNIADWVRRFGGGFDHMIVLDADSLMTGEALVRLAGMMQDDPRAGLIQTVPRVIGGRTLFARLEQFASRLYGPMFARGMAWWSGTEGNYWGHNAIIRVSAFAEQAGLPHLEGRRPFGGHILSHDFVEAALMRRAGWSIRLEADVEGSWEEGPPTLIDQFVRDRRWCQGNLQHMGVIGAQGLNPVSRFHLLRGFSAYLAAPMWVALLTLSVALMVFPQTLAGVEPQGATAQRGALLVLLGISAAFLILPKFMAFDAVVSRGELERFGGAGALTRSILMETAVSTLIAPVALFAQTRAVISVLSGRDSGWKAQRRDIDQLSLSEAFAAHRLEFGFGLGLAAVCLVLQPAALIWAAAPAIGLGGAFLLSAATARRFASETLLATPEILSPPAIIREAQLQAEAAPPMVAAPVVAPAPAPAQAASPVREPTRARGRMAPAAA